MPVIGVNGFDFSSGGTIREVNTSNIGGSGYTGENTFDDLEPGTSSYDPIWDELEADIRGVRDEPLDDATLERYSRRYFQQADARANQNIAAAAAGLGSDSSPVFQLVASGARGQAVADAAGAELDAKVQNKIAGFEAQFQKIAALSQVASQRTQAGLAERDQRLREDAFSFDQYMSREELRRRDRDERRQEEDRRNQQMALERAAAAQAREIVRMNAQNGRMVPYHIAYEYAYSKLVAGGGGGYSSAPKGGGGGGSKFDDFQNKFWSSHAQGGNPPPSGGGSPSSASSGATGNPFAGTTGVQAPPPGSGNPFAGTTGVQAPGGRIPPYGGSISTGGGAVGPDGVGPPAPSNRPFA